METRKGIKLKKTVKCLGCMTAKAKRKTIKKFTLQREMVPGRTLNINISSVKSKSKVGKKIWLQIADGATSKKWRFF